MIFLRKIIMVVMSAACISMSAADSDSYDPFDLNLEQNINTPAVPSKSQSMVKENIDRIKSHLERQGFRPTRTRRGEVLLLTIPCEQLFRANESVISTRGVELLKKFTLPAESIGKYKILIAVHSDDTGEIEYTDNLTADRANAIDDLFSAENKFAGMSVVPYGIGRDEPLVRNDSVKNRAQNRRVEIYIVPEEELFSKRKTVK
ncbi:MAG: OmpA family protein [Muribaculaceae bacterium]|nr:OmpA family protein [Muribaculaceae bacterium]